MKYAPLMILFCLLLHNQRTSCYLFPLKDNMHVPVMVQLILHTFSPSFGLVSLTAFIAYRKLDKNNIKLLLYHIIILIIIIIYSI